MGGQPSSAFAHATSAQCRRVGEALLAGQFPPIRGEGGFAFSSLDRASLLQLLQSFDVQRRSEKLRQQQERKAAGKRGAARSGKEKGGPAERKGHEQVDRETLSKCPTCSRRRCEAQVMRKDALYFSREGESLVCELREVLDDSGRQALSNCLSFSLTRLSPADIQAVSPYPPKPQLQETARCSCCRDTEAEREAAHLVRGSLLSFFFLCFAKRTLQKTSTGLCCMRLCRKRNTAHLFTSFLCEAPHVLAAVPALASAALLLSAFLSVSLVEAACVECYKLEGVCAFVEAHAERIQAAATLHAALANNQGASAASRSHRFPAAAAAAAASSTFPGSAQQRATSLCVPRTHCSSSSSNSSNSSSNSSSSSSRQGRRVRKAETEALASTRISPAAVGILKVQTAGHLPLHQPASPAAPAAAAAATAAPRQPLAAALMLLTSPLAQCRPEPPV
ncbi:hypothetical protein Esti_005468 [Eimeria stiedai]